MKGRENEGINKRKNEETKDWINEIMIEAAIDGTTQRMNELIQKRQRL